MVNYNPVKFGWYSHSGSRDKMFLACHVVSREHLVKESCDLMGGVTSRLVTIFQALMAVVTVVVEICF